MILQNSLEKVFGGLAHDHVGWTYGLEQKDEYFVQKRNAARVLGLSSLQKMTTALRMLAYGVVADFTDEYVRIGEIIAIESQKICWSHSQYLFYRVLEVTK